MATALVEGASRAARPARSRLYVGLALLVTAIVILGFGPSFYAMLVEGVPQPWAIHAHAVIYMGWLALLVAQAALAARGRIDLHRRLGNAGIAYGGLVLIVGLIVSVVLPAMHVRAGEWTLDEAAAFLPIPLGDMALFGGFFAGAVLYRHRPEIHKRLVLLAAVALMFPAVSRFFFSEGTAVRLIAWYLPVAIGMGYDLVRKRRVHPVYWLGAAIMAIGLARIPFGQSELWRPIGRALVAPLT